MKSFFFTLLFLACGFCATAQNYLFEKGQNGFHIAGQAAFPKGSTVFGILPGYTWDGRFSMGVGAGREHSKDFDLTSFSIKPTINYLIVKQSQGGAPLSVGLGMAYQSNWFKDYDDLKMGTISFDLGLHHRIYMEGKSSLIPGAFMGWGQTKMSDNQDSYKQDQFMGGVQLAILMNKFHLTPAFQFAKETNLFVITAGFIFPGSK